MTDTNSSTPRPLWTWEALSAGLAGKLRAGPAVRGVGVDSRTINSGELFIALPGDPGPRFNPGYRSAVDGHDFVAAAAAVGAAGAMVHKPREAVQAPVDFPLLEVGDTYDGLWTLGKMARTRFTGDVIAVTGSSGKTTAKQFLAAALNAYAPPGSFNNHIGVPLSLANLSLQESGGVFEIGTNHPGEIEPLAEMTAADVAILLNVHKAHIENFPDAHSLLKEKLTIFNPLKDKSRAISEDILALNFGLSFGESRQADARVVELSGDLATIRFLGRPKQVRVPGGGIHRAKTVAVTLLACHLLERDLAPACDLPMDIVPKGRGNLLRIGDITLVDDSYNANPDSMLAALRSFATLNLPGRKVTLIGEMLELGNEARQAHLDLKPALERMDAVFCVGEGTRELAEKLGAPWHAAADEALLQALSKTLSGPHSVLVKGSNRVFWSAGFMDKLTEELQG